MSFDHGVLNVPLSKRGDLYREIERNVAAQKREREERMRAARKQFGVAKRDALGLVERMSDEHVARFAAKSGMPKRSVRKWLRERAGINPQLVAKALREGGAE